MQQHTGKEPKSMASRPSGVLKIRSHLLSLINVNQPCRNASIKQLRFLMIEVDWLIEDWLIGLKKKKHLGYFLSKSFILASFRIFVRDRFCLFRSLSRPSCRFVSGLWRLFKDFSDFIFEHGPNQPCSNRATKRPSKNSSMISSCAARFSPLGAPAWVQHSKEDHPNYTKWFGSGE